MSDRKQVQSHNSTTLDDDDFLSIWSLIRNDTNHLNQVITVRQLAKSRNLQARHAIKVLNCFSSSDKVDVLCILLNSISDLYLEKSILSLLSCFKGSHRLYVAQVLEETKSILGSGERKLRKTSRRVFIPPNLLFCSRSQVTRLIHSISRSRYSSNQATILDVISNEVDSGIRFEELKYFINSILTWSDGISDMGGDKTKAEDSLIMKTLKRFNPLVLSLTSAEVAEVTSVLESSKLRMQVLRLLLQKVVDPENIQRELTTGQPPLIHIDDLQSLVETLPRQPSSPIFGEQSASSTLFVLDCSTRGNHILTLQSGERISVLRFVVQHLSRVLKEHIRPSQKFNIQVFSGSSIYWMKEAVHATRANVDNASLFLRTLKAEGSCDLHSALTQAFYSNVEEISLILTGSAVSQSSKFEVHRLETVSEKLVAGLQTRHENIFSCCDHLKDKNQETGEEEMRNPRPEEGQEPGSINFGSISSGVLHNVDETELSELLHISRCNAKIKVTGLLVDIGDYDHEVRTMQKLLRSVIMVFPPGKRFMSLVDIGERRKQVNTSTSLVWTYKNTVIDYSEARAWQLLNFLFYICLIGGVALQRVGYIATRSCSQVSSRYPTYITGSSSLFILWPISFICAGAIVAFLCHRSRIHPQDSTTPFPIVGDGILRPMGMIVPSYTVGTLGWHWAFANESFNWATTFGLLQLLVLIRGIQVVKRHLSDSMTETWNKLNVFLRMPMSIMLAWSSYNIVLTIATNLVAANWYWFSMDSEWAIITLLGLTVLGAYITTTQRDMCYGFTTVAILLGIALPHIDDANFFTADLRSMRTNASMVIVLSCYTCSAILLALSLSAIFARVQFRFLALKLESIPRANLAWEQGLSYVPGIQAVSLVSFSTLLIVYGGMGRLLPDSCGFVARELWQEYAPLYWMPAPFTFLLFPFLFAHYGLFVLLPCMLPSEAVLNPTTTAVGLPEIILESDRDTVTFLKRSSTKAWKAYPRIWNWRLSRFGHHIVFDVLGGYYALLHAAIAVFQVAFRMRRFVPALFFLVISWLSAWKLQTLYLDLMTDFRREVASGTSRAKLRISRFVTITIGIPIGICFGWLTFLLCLMTEIVVRRDEIDNGRIGVALFMIRADHFVVLIMCLLSVIFVLKSWASRSAIYGIGLLWGLAGLAVENLHNVCINTTSAARKGLENIPQVLSNLGQAWFDVEDKMSCQEFEKRYNYTNNMDRRKEVAAGFRWIDGKCRGVYLSTSCNMKGEVNAGIAVLGSFTTNETINWLSEFDHAKIQKCMQDREPKQETCICVEHLGVCPLSWSTPSINEQFLIQSPSPTLTIGLTGLSFSSLLGLNALLFAFLTMYSQRKSKAI